MNTTKTIGLLTIVALIALPLGACGGNKSAEEQVKDQTSKLYKLTDEERSLATANAKKYFEQTWPVNGGRPAVQGKLINCRPTDSNKNGLVSCTGYIADVHTGDLVEKTVYAGYRPDLVGVSDQDTVAP